MKATHGQIFAWEHGHGKIYIICSRWNIFYRYYSSYDMTLINVGKFTENKINEKNKIKYRQTVWLSSSRVSFDCST